MKGTEVMRKLSRVALVARRSAQAALLVAAMLGAATFSRSIIDRAAGQAATQAVPQHLDAAQFYATTVTTATTLTLTPAAGQSVYLTSVHISNCAGSSAVTAAAPTSITSTNLNGLTYQMGSGVTAGVCIQESTDLWPNGFKAAAPGAVTIVMPTFAANQTIRVGVSWYSAP